MIILGVLVLIIASCYVFALSLIHICLVFAGAVCRQILERRGITITANAVRVGQATGRELNLSLIHISPRRRKSPIRG